MCTSSQNLRRGRWSALRLAARALLVLAGISGSALAQGKQPVRREAPFPTDALAAGALTPFTFNTWFSGGTATLNGFVQPANSLTFSQPYYSSAPQNSIFYSWAYQMFLWLTSPVTAKFGDVLYAAVFESPTFYDVSPANAAGARTFIPHDSAQPRSFSVRAAQAGVNDLPVVMSRDGKMYEVEKSPTAANGNQIVANAAGQRVEVSRIGLVNGKPILYDTKGNEIANARALVQTAKNSSRLIQELQVGRRLFYLDILGNPIDTEENQATGGVLIAQNGSLVYYETTVNDVYAYFRTQSLENGAANGQQQFPTTQAELDGIVAYAHAHGRTIPDPNALAIEIKTAWVETTGLPDPSSYITTTATIPAYDKSNPTHWVQNGQKTTTLALVGMHVVGSVKGHPEMIWSTFEHQYNAPNAAYVYAPATYVPVTATGVVAMDTRGQWLFCAYGATGGFNTTTQVMSGMDIISTGATNIGPNNALRYMPWGASSDNIPNPIVFGIEYSNAELLSINTSVHAGLVAGDIRRNYVMNGATWTNGGAAFHDNYGNPANGGNQPGQAVGTSQLSNMTMETFQTTKSNFDKMSNNCFSCHQSATNSTDYSHVYHALKKLF
ncbi:MAG: hypothetical protein ABI442_21855 [Gemmatimonadaceae bacterium]